MSKTAYEVALSVTEKLADRSEEALYEELGLRIQDAKNVGGYKRSEKYSAEYTQVAYENELSVADLKKIGRRWFRNIEKKLMKLLCDPGNDDLKKITSGRTIPQVAASLATAALISTLAAPAWIIVATTILAAKIAEAGLESLCEVWRESLGNE